MLNIQRLKEELVRNNMKQRDLANRIGVNEVTVSRYCNGTRMPRRHILVKIASTFIQSTTPYIYFQYTASCKHSVFYP